MGAGGATMEIVKMAVARLTSECNNTEDIFNTLLQCLELGNVAEFQLPDSLKRMKPVPYNFIKRNIYLTKKIKRRIEDDGIFCSCSPSSSMSSVCGIDCHCGMLLSTCSLSCKCGNACLNKPFQNRAVKKMKLVKTEKCGSGLVADDDIKQGEFVIEYVGEVIDDKTCEDRLWEMKRRGETNFYLCEINRDMVIDATYKGNKSRFINHSCQPNTEMQKWRIDGETRIGIFATRDIRKGEDLTYDYQFVQFGEDQNCYCGALSCRQKLGNKPSKPKLSSDAALKLVAPEVAVSSPSVKALLSKNEDYSTGPLDNGNLQHALPSQRKSSFWNCIGKSVQILRPHEDRCLRGCVSHYNSSSRKHTIILEDRQEVILDMSEENWEVL
ncbi:hypothetical protein AAC387_Pa12g0307 [Persea americana]